MRKIMLILLSLFAASAFACSGMQGKITSLSVKPVTSISFTVTPEVGDAKIFIHDKPSQSLDATSELFELAKLAYIEKLTVCAYSEFGKGITLELVD